MSNSKSGKSYIDRLEQEFLDVDDLKSKVLSNQTVFWTSQLGFNKWEVRPKVFARLCLKYVLNGGECYGDCFLLHLCKENLLSSSSCTTPCKHGLSHNLRDSHNKDISRKIFPKCYRDESTKIKILRSSFPRLCKTFTEKGKCDKVFCGSLHICTDYVNGDCVSFNNCKQANLCRLSKSIVHDFLRGHNKKVISLFCFGNNFDKKELLGNILRFDETFSDSLQSFHAPSAASSVSNLSCSSTTREDLNSQKLLLILCYYYLIGSCSNMSCPRLHLCKEFLINGNKCKRNCKYGFSHDPLDSHNKRIIDDQVGMEIPGAKVLQIIRKLFPRVCRDYIDKRCLTGDMCDRLHVCNTTLSNSQCYEHGCSKSHDLQDEHNLEILKRCSLDGGGRRVLNTNYLLANIMYSTPNMKVDNDQNKQFGSTRNFQIPSSASSVPNLSYPSAGNTLPNRLKLKLCFHYLNGNCKKGSCPRLHMCKEFLINGNRCQGICKYGFSHDAFDNHNKEIIENENTCIPSWKILEIVRKSFPRVCRDYLDGICQSGFCDRLHACEHTLVNKICQMECLKSHDLQDTHNLQVFKLFSLDIGPFQTLRADFLTANILYTKHDAQKIKTNYVDYATFLTAPYTGLKVFNNGNAVSKSSYNNDHYRIVKDRNGTETVFVCPAHVKPCFYYWRKNTGCRNDNCDMFHICKKYLFDEKHKNVVSCEFSHNFQSIRNQNLINKHGFQTLNDEQLQITLRLRYPEVCEEWSEDGVCSKGENFCPNAHVCVEFLKGKCSKLLCSFNHEEGLKNVHAKRLMKEFHINEKDFRCCVMLPKPKRNEQNNRRFKRRQQKEKQSNNMMNFSSDTDDSVNEELPNLEDCVPLKTTTPSTNSRVSPKILSTTKGQLHDVPIPLMNVEILPQFCQPTIQKTHIGVSVKPQSYLTSVQRKNTVTPLVPTNAFVKEDCVPLKPILKTTTAPAARTPPSTNSGSIFLNSTTENKSPMISSTEQIHSTSVQRKSTTLSMSKLKKEVSNVWEEPSEIDVFAHILKTSENASEGYVRIGDRKFLAAFFNNDETHVEDWFKKHLSTFRISAHECCGGPYFYMCLENVAPCYKYWVDKCRTSNCDKFHICKMFLHGIPHSGVSCKFNHGFRSPRELQLISLNQLDPLSSKELQLLLRIRYPLICKDYLNSRCNDVDLCSYVHICGDFLEGKCLKQEGLCRYNHEHGLRSKQAARLMKEYHIDTVSHFKKCIIFWKSQDEEKATKRTRVSLKPNFNWLTEEAICYKHLNGDCDSCNIYHLDSGLPYAWEYFSNDTWQEFSTRLNTEMEKCYCDPTKDSFDSTCVDTTLKRLIVKNGWLHAIYEHTAVNIRRLSTKSSVLSNEVDVVGLTEWKWYWNNNNKWDDYTKWTTSNEIEKSYLKNSKGSHQFKTDEFKYVLSFGDMQQQNMDERYFTKRQVKRRPVFKSKKSLSKVTQIITVNNDLPWYWPIEDVNLRGGQIDVTGINKLKIISQFEGSLNHSIQIIDVAEICNSEFYEKYQGKKRALSSKLGSGNINELSLYHGTAANVVDGICAQNFDWRLCGKNATMYGQGSYFAKNASYSHNYTTQDSNNFRYMFVAQVLAGKSIVGDSSMKRPPAINPSVDAHALYDSCVDKQYNPSIYVIFERDQCYPQYLITYINLADIGYLSTAAMNSKKTEFKPKPLSIRPSSTNRQSPSRSTVDISASTLYRPASLVHGSASPRRSPVVASTNRTPIPAKTKKECVIS